MATCGRVYFVQCSFTGRIKIGWTKQSPDDRFAAIKTASPTRVYLIGHIKGSRETEAAFHDSLSNANCHGEWFEPTQTVVEVLAAVGVQAWPKHVAEPWRKQMKILAAQEDELIEAAREEFARYRVSENV